MVTGMDDNLKKNIKRVYANIDKALLKGGRNPGEVTVVAVSKTVPVERVKDGINLGLLDLGENRLQEALLKIREIPATVRWHFIGHLQTNKVKDVLEPFYLIHSLDRLKLAVEINRQAERMNQYPNVLVQVNTSGELSKGGVSPVDLKDFLSEVRTMERIKVRGLMTMAPFVDDPEEVRPVFKETRLLRDRMLEELPELDLSILSMGMSGDYQVAVEEGANMVRVGTGIFGARC